MKLIISLVLTIFYFTDLRAQDKQIHIADILFDKNHIIFAVTPNITFKGTATTDTGSQSLTTNNMLGSQLGINYIFNITKSTGIKTGIGIGFTPYDWGYNLKSPYDSLHLITDSDANKLYPVLDRDYFSYISIPLELEWRKEISKKSWLLLSTGISLKWYREEFGEYGFLLYGDTNTVDRLTINTANITLNVTIPLMASAGIGILLKNNDLIALNITGNFATTNAIKGTYKISPGTSHESTGIYTKNGSYIGFEIGYRFTQSKNQIKKISNHATEKSTRNKITNNDVKTIFSKNQLGLNIGINKNLKPKAYPSTGNKPELKGLYTPQIDLSYTLNRNETFGWQFGVTLSSLNYKYEERLIYDSVLFSSATFNAQQSFAHYGIYTGFELRKPLKNNILFFTDLDITIKMLFDNALYYGVIYTNNLSQVFGTTTNKPMMGTKVTAGLLFINRNYNIWRIGLGYNYSYSTAASENYIINLENNEVKTGSVKLKGNYIAFEIGYIYSLNKSKNI